MVRRRKTVFLLFVLVLAYVSLGGVNAETDAPIEVSDAEELDDVRDSLDGDYVLVDDIDASGIEFEPIGVCDFRFESSGEGTDGGEEADETEDAQGVCAGEAFDGTFDGDGHTVKGLTVDTDDDEAGLFGYVGRNATVRDVGVADAEVSGVSAVGVVAGRLDGEIERVHAEGTATGEGIVGGLVGVNVGGTVADSHADVDVSSRNFAGGLAGLVEGNLSRSFAVGEVTGAGSDRGTGGVAGLLNGELRSSYWDTETTGQTDSVAAMVQNSSVENVEGLTTEEMTGSTAEESMEGLEFGGVWENVTVPEMYPRLYWESGPPEVATFELTLGTEEATVTRGESLTVTAEVTNVGRGAGTAEVGLIHEGDVVETERTGTIGPGEAGTVEFVGDTSQLQPGTYEGGVRTEDNTETGVLTVERPTPADTRDDDVEVVRHEIEAEAMSGFFVVSAVVAVFALLAVVFARRRAGL